MICALPSHCDESPFSCWDGTPCSTSESFLPAFAGVIQTGATSSVEAIKMNAKLTVGRTVEEGDVRRESARPRCGS
jgi:hypothetical protein